MNIELTPTRAKQSVMGTTKPMSASLRERLKRCGRYHAGTGSPGASNQPSRNSVKAADPSGLDSASATVNKTLFSDSLGASHSNNLTERRVVQSPDNLTVSELGGTNILCKDKTGWHRKRKAGDTLDENHPGKEVISAQPMVKRTSCYLHSTFRSEFDQEDCDADKKDNVYHKENTHTSTKNSATPEKSACSSSRLSVEHSSDHIVDSVHRSVKDSEDGSNLNLQSQIQHLDSELKDKLELLRKLKMVKMYREKNDLIQLQQLIDRWRGVSQAALADLLRLQPEPRPSMEALISHLQIDPNLVQFDAEEQDFL